MGVRSQIEALKEVVTYPRVLIVILDACRWDVWWSVTKRGVPVRSPASQTNDWLKAVRSIEEFKSFGCVAANPLVVQAGVFGQVVSCLNDWEYVNDIPTVPPEKVMWKALIWQRMRGWKKFVVWFIQPHGPYPLDCMPVFRVARFLDRTRGGRRLLCTQDELRLVEVDRWKDAYRRNLEWALVSVRQLIRAYRGWKVVVTSDHGECFGEDGIFGHPGGVDVDCVRIVPWWEA